MRISASPLGLVLATALAGCNGAAVPPGSNGITSHAPSIAHGAPAWIPAAGSTFAVQYVGKLDTTVQADAFDVDGFDTKGLTVAVLHAQQRRAVCYIDVGTWENWRSDAGRFPKSVLGKPDGGWPGERWLDIRKLSVLEPIMSARFEMCKDKGFDAVDPDNIDGYQNATGFPLTATEQLAYDKWVAQAVHHLGLAVAQKNDPSQIGKLDASFDFAVIEQCARYHFCGRFAPYTAQNRLVVDIEYGTPRSKFINDVCPETAKYHETALLKHLNLNAWVVTCPD